MDKRKFPLLLTSIATVILLTFSSCEKNLHEMTIQLINGSATDIHLWIQGESIDPSNKLSPGASRTITTKIEREENQPTVSFKAYAGQNGQTLTSKTFETAGIIVVIRYSGGTLVME